MNDYLEKLQQDESVATEKQIPKWAEEAKAALEEELEVEVLATTVDRDYVEFESVRGRARNGESEWIVFKDEKSAEKYAYDYVKDMLDNEPEIFNQDFLEKFLYITDTDKRLIANDEADAWVEGMDDEDTLEYAEMLGEYEDYESEIDDKEFEAEDLADELESLSKRAMGDDYDPQREREVESKLKAIKSEIEKLHEEKDRTLDAAKDSAIELKYDEVLSALESPYEYFVNEQGIYTRDEFFKASFVSLDTEEAAKEAIRMDGIEHFLDRYDSQEERLSTGAIAYGTN